MPFDTHSRSALDATPEQRQARYEELWERGGFNFFLDNYIDITTNEEANRSLADFVQGKIREIVRDPETAEKLIPDHFIGTKRPILDNGYFETYNRDNVTLVDLREDPIGRFTASGVRTRTGDHPLDVYVLATDRVLSEVGRHSPTSITARHTVLPLAEVAIKLGIKGPYDSRFSDRIFAQLVAKRAPANHYAPSAQTRYFRLDRLRRGLIVASVFLLMGGLALGAASFVDGLTSIQDTASASREASFYSSRYERARS